MRATQLECLVRAVMAYNATPIAVESLGAVEQRTLLTFAIAQESERRAHSYKPTGR
jgi:hypothetical protein